jgi:hypothetical protein
MQIIPLAIIIIALLAYFKVDLHTIFGQTIFQKFLNIFIVAWGTYVKPLLVYLAASIFGLFK